MDEEVRVKALPCVCAELRRASRAVTRLYDEAQRATGLSSGQMTLLFALEDGPRMQRRLGEVFSMDTTTLTRTLRALAKEGYIVSREGTADRRERWHELTAKGRHTVRVGHAHWEAVQRALLGRLEGRVDWSALQRSLHVIVEAAGD
jgi:DNA-binding MarR family transcriptional regulator